MSENETHEISTLPWNLKLDYSTDSKGETGLYNACGGIHGCGGNDGREMYQIDVINLLISNGCDVDQRNCEGQTALMYTSQLGSVEYSSLREKVMSMLRAFLLRSLN